MFRPGRPILYRNIFKLVTQTRILDPMIFRAFPVKALENSANFKSISYASAVIFSIIPSWIQILHGLETIFWGGTEPKLLLKKLLKAQKNFYVDFPTPCCDLLIQDNSNS